MDEIIPLAHSEALEITPPSRERPKKMYKHFGTFWHKNVF
jgi:hypothetical protein